MRILSSAVLAGAMIVAVSSGSFAGPLSSQIRSDGLSPIEAVQQKAKKDETVKQKVKRVWRNMTGYKFNVGCPAFLPLSQGSCTETGKNRGTAQAKCQSRHPWCSVTEAN